MDGVVIDDGDPWWLSPSVWAVPSSSPGDPSPGVLAPVSGHAYYLKATVRNSETYRIENARVDFFWSGPTAGLTRLTASQVGTAFMSADAGKAVEVLCLTPWIPSYAHQGHECIVAAVTQPGGATTATLDAPNDVHVAQRNLSVLLVSGSQFSLAFEICNSSLADRVVDVRVEPGRMKEVARFTASALPTLARARGKAVELEFVRSPCCDPEAEKGPPSLERLEIAATSCTGATLVGRLEGTAALIHITQVSGNEVIGGLSALVLREEATLADQRS